MSTQEFNTLHETKKNLRKYKSISGKLHRKRGLYTIIICFSLLFSFNIGTRYFFHEHINGFAEWRVSESQKYLYAEAEDSYSLGYLTGTQLWREIWSLKVLLISMAPLYQSSYSELKELSSKYLDFIPDNIIEEMKGMARGVSAVSGFFIRFDDILVQNVWYDAFYGQILPSSIGPLGCTAIGVRDAENETILSQNFDLNGPFAKTLSFVQHKLPGKPTIFGLRLGGGINLPIAKTSQNVSVLVTLVQTNFLANFTQPVLIRTRNALEQSKDALSFYSNFYENSQESNNCGFNLIITDPNRIIGVETCPNGTILQESDLIVKTNTYSNPMWQSYLLNQTYSKERQNYATEYIQDCIDKQNISENCLLSLLKVDPLICQRASNLKESETLAYFTSSYFGLGNLVDTKLGNIPI